MKPNINKKIRAKQSDIVRNSSPKRGNKYLKIGSDVYICNFGVGSYWLKGKVVYNHGPVTWLVKLKDRKTIQRHSDHIRLNSDNSDDIISAVNAPSNVVSETACCRVGYDSK